MISFAEVLPQLATTQRDAELLIQEFSGAEYSSLKSADDLISYLQNTANQVGFTVDSLKVERGMSAREKNVPKLTALVKGAGSFEDIENYMGEVSANQNLLSEASMQVSRSANPARPDDFRADITFELVLFRAANLSGGG
ncbi:hypothetical protein P4C99_11030 [Pontiellaceae bacterium B1224]|nr:hypothetical protein [Pontiellaceae bacterium B1224]